MIDPLTLDQMRDLRRRRRDRQLFRRRATSSAACNRRSASRSQTMEATLGVTLFDRSDKTPALTDAGAAIVKDARALLERARGDAGARARASPPSVEPELSLAVDPIFPMPLLMASLKALRDAFPELPATIFTETLGGSEQRLRDGVAHFAICADAARPASRDLAAEFLAAFALAPVVAADHPLAREPEPDRARDARAPCPARAHRPHAADARTAAAASSATTSGASPISRPGSNSCSPVSAGATCRCTWSRPISPPDG